MAASLQHLLDGRLIFGYGAGWAEDEYRAYGYDYPPASTRIDQLDEALTVIKALWAGGPVDHHGRWFQLEGAICEPHPEPLPVVMVGGEGRRTMDVAARQADWWNCLHRPVQALRERLEQLDRACERVGRDPVSLLRSMYLTVFLARDGDSARGAAGARLDSEHPPFAGDPAQLVDHLGRLRELGFGAFQLVFAGFPDTADLELFAECVLPAFRVHDPTTDPGS
jgi:alkanesulfonate monooxygenase SsuD/methylene tetrahydromethanopterin reductase-like flavin-dependent oxidoreductase (luciferase family)